MSLNYEQYIKEQKLKNTAQRRVLFDMVLKSKTHFTIDELLAKVQKKFAGIGYATVYRMLKNMVDAGLVIEHHFDEKARYELNLDRAHHDHLICNKCGKIVEFSCQEIEDLQDKIAKNHGFAIVHHKHELYGLCSDCT